MSDSGYLDKDEDEKIDQIILRKSIEAKVYTKEELNREKMEWLKKIAPDASTMRRSCCASVVDELFENAEKSLKEEK